VDILDGDGVLTVCFWQPRRPLRPQAPYRRSFSWLISLAGRGERRKPYLPRLVVLFPFFLPLLLLLFPIPTSLLLCFRFFYVFRFFLVLFTLLLACVGVGSFTRPVGRRAARTGHRDPGSGLRHGAEVVGYAGGRIWVLDGNRWRLMREKSRVIGVGVTERCTAQERLGYTYSDYVPYTLKRSCGTTELMPYCYLCKL
jgi:hypothetical protein